MKPTHEDLLSREDRVLWGRVARTVAPLPGRRSELEQSDSEDFATLLSGEPTATKEIPAPLPPARPAQPRVDNAQHRLDRPTHDKLAKGRLPIEGKVDLHGLTQSEAHALLLAFLHRAYAEGRRHVLVVTGKGSSFGSDGVLRRAVPAWLATPSFRSIVGSHETAARGHGGGGALYVRLRRQGGER